MASKIYNFSLPYSEGTGSRKISIILTDNFNYSSGGFNSYSELGGRKSITEIQNYVNEKLGIDLAVLNPTVNNITDTTAEEYENSIGLMQWELQTPDREMTLGSGLARYHILSNNYDLQYKTGNSWIAAAGISLNVQTRYHDVRSSTIVLYATDVNDFSSVVLTEQTSTTYKTMVLTTTTNTSNTTNTQTGLYQSSIQKEFLDLFLGLTPVSERFLVIWKPQESEGNVTFTEDPFRPGRYSYQITTAEGYTFNRVVIRDPDGNIIQKKFFSEIGIVDTDTSETRPYFFEVFSNTDKNPLDDGGTSTEGGGDGNFDSTSDSVNVPGLPTALAVDTGFVTILNPTLAQVKSLSAFLWQADATKIDFWKKLVANPMDLILGFSIVPVSVTDGGQISVKVGTIDTGVTMTRAASQYVTVDCGSVSIPKYWGSSLDYSPYTRLQLYLPYIGIETIDVDEVMGKNLGVVYHVDILSGSLICYVTVDGSVLYSYLGHCAQQLPLSSENFASMISAALNVTTSAIGAVAKAAGGDVMAAAQGLATTAQNISGLKPTFEHSGTLAGPGSQLGIQTPYLIITRPRQSLAEDYKHFEGYPSNITSRLSDLSGFTRVESIRLENILASDSEKEEIERLLKEGVIL